MESTIRRRNSEYSGSNVLGMESDTASMHPLLSWRSVVAGLLISFLCLAGFLGLGLAFGGISLDEDTSFRAAGIFSGVWFLVSAFISLFVGSYYAARVSKFQTGRIGSAQGLVIASLFLGFFLYQIISAVGIAGSAAGNAISGGAGAITAGAQRAAQSDTIVSTVNNMAEDAMGDLNLRSEPATVATGVANRLVRGDTESAKNYLALQAGIAPTEADARIGQLQTRVSAFIDDTKNAAGNALKSMGWSLFLLVILGSLSAVGGGALGSITNFRKPLSREQYGLKQEHA